MTEKKLLKGTLLYKSLTSENKWAAETKHQSDKSSSSSNNEELNIISKPRKSYMSHIIWRIWYVAYQVKLSEINPWWMTGRYWFHLQLMAPCQEKTWTDCYKLEPRTPYQRADDVPVEVFTLINPYLENLK